MRYNVFFLDTEFVIRGGPGHIFLDLLSIGIVRDCGSEYYAQNYNSYSKPHQFVIDQVLPKFDHLDFANSQRARCDLDPPKCLPTASGSCPWRTIDQIASDLCSFFPESGKNVILTDGGAHDIILLTTIFRGYENVPNHIPRQFIDHDVIQNTFCHHGTYVGKNNRPHHALYDARALRDEYYYHIARCRLFSDLMEYTPS